MKRKAMAALLAGTMTMGLMTGSLCVSAEEARTFKILSMWAEDDMTVDLF